MQLWDKRPKCLSKKMTKMSQRKKSQSGRFTDGRRSGRTTRRLSTFMPDTDPSGMTLPKQRGSGLTASTPVSDVSAPACRDRVWFPLRLVCVAQKNKPSTMLFSDVQSIDPLRTARPDGSGRWDNQMAAKHLPRELVWLSSGQQQFTRKKKKK